MVEESKAEKNMAQEGCSKEKGKPTKSGTKTMEKDLSLRKGVGKEESANDTRKKNPERKQRMRVV